MTTRNVAGIAVVAAAVVGLVVAVVVGGRPDGDPRDATAQDRPAAAERGVSQISETMPKRTVSWKGKEWYRDKEPERTVEFSARGFRRIGPQGTTYLIAVSYLVFDGRGGNDGRTMDLLADDAAKLAAFCEKPMGGLPAAAAEGPEAIEGRSWIGIDAFKNDGNRLEVSHNTKNKGTGAYEENVRYTSGRYIWFNAAKWVEAIRAAEKDIATLKAHPAKW